METIDFTKYKGSFSLSEAKEIATQMIADIFEAEKKQALNHAESIHGNTFTYKLTKGTRPNLMKLKNGQGVCASGVKGFHILMTPKQ
jgi:uncharacterized membrane-anchored protein